MSTFSEKLTFFRQFVHSPKMVGSIIPTSDRVIERLLSHVDWQTAQIIVEYGPGIGTFTRPILARLRPDARLIAIDTCADFIAHLSERIDDPRLTLVHGSAADIASVLEHHAGGQKADYVVSGLPFSTLPPGVGARIVAATADALNPGGAFLIYQYSLFVLPLLRPYFPQVIRAKTWRNIPPCHIVTAHKEEKSALPSSIPARAALGSA